MITRLIGLPRSGRVGLLAVMAAMVLFIAVAGAVQAKPSTEDAVDYLKNAREYVTKGEFKAAVIELKNALQADPGNIDARFLLGEVYLQLGDGPSAEKEFRAARRGGLDDAAATLRLAQALLLQAKFDDVLKEVNVADIDPEGQADAYVMLGRAHLGKRQFDEARAAFEKAEELRPKGLQAKVGLARIYAQTGKLAEAETELDKALDISPQFANALVLKGELARLRGDGKRAVSLFTSALKVQPRNLAALLGRAASLIDLDRDEEAQKDIDAILKIAPSHPLAIHFEAMRLAKKRKFQEANDILQKAGSTLDNYLPNVYLRGVIHYALGHFEQARANLARFVQAVPQHITARRLLGAALIRQKEFTEAVKVLRPLAEGDSADAKGLALLGAAYMGSGDYAKATEYFERAASANPEAASIRTQLALSKLAGGDAEGAITNLETAVELNPQVGQAAVLLALVELRKKDFPKALETAQGLERKSPKNPLAANLVGAAYLGMGALEKAREAFKRALDLKSDYYPAMMNLAQIDLRQDKADAARRQYRNIIKGDPKQVGAMMALAELERRANNLDEAVRWLERAMNAAPANIEPGVRLVTLYLNDGKVDRALATASELALKHPNAPQVLELLGRTQMAAKDVDSAVASFRKLADRLPHAPQAQNLLGRALAAASDPEGARQAFRRALAENADFRPARESLIALETQQGNLDTAMSLAQDLRKKYPNDAAVDMLVGDIYMRQEQPADALIAYGEAQKKEASSALAVRLFRARKALGNVDQALDGLKVWVDTHPKGIALRHVLAGAYLDGERFADAIAQYERLEQDDPANRVVVLNNLAWLYQRVGSDKAVPTAEKAYALAPNSAEVTDTLGWVLLSSGDKTRGLDLLRSAAAMAPTSPEIRYHFAVALNQNGRLQEARRELQDILNMGKEFDSAKEARGLLDKLGQK